MADYFNLHVNLTEKADAWAAADKRYREIAPYIYGARMLRQHPIECVFQFICSANNNIARIGGMVEHLCATYGTPLDVPADAFDSTRSATAPAKAKGKKKVSKATKRQEEAELSGPQLRYYAFPSLEQLQAATEESLREASFGYRARYIVETVQLLTDRPEGMLLSKTLRVMLTGDNLALPG